MIDLGLHLAKLRGERAANRQDSRPLLEVKLGTAEYVVLDALDFPEVHDHAAMYLHKTSWGQLLDELFERGSDQVAFGGRNRLRIFVAGVKVQHFVNGHQACGIA